MSKIFLLIALVGTISLMAASTDVSLSGTVKDESGAAIEGVSLSLAKEPSLKTTTNAQGAFTLAGRTATLHRAPYDIAIQNSLNVGSKSNTLRFSISADGIGGSISFFNASGRSVSYLPLNDLRAGTNYILLPKLSTGFYLARITVDNRTSTCILVSTSSGVYISERVPSGFSPSLSKSTTGEPGAVDTIIAKKEGFETVKKVIASYTLENVEIIMKRVVLEECTPTQLPATSALPVNKGLPSPFRFFDGTEMTRKDEWPCRRQEILDMAYKYMYGPMPPFAAPEVEVTGTVSGSGVTANISYKGKSATLNFGTSGNGDVLLISMGSGITPPQAHRTYSVNNTVINGWKNNCNSLFGMSPCGEIALGWGCNILCRAISSDPDGGIDSNKIMTTGCSNTAKAAFLAAAFCEGIDLTVVVESGGFGDASFRVAEYLYHDKNGWKCSDPPQGVWSPDHGSQWLAEPYMDATVSAWVVNTPANIYKLPYDQHSLAACIAPRAACLLTNQNGQAGSGEWCHLNGTGSAISYWAAEPVWNALGVPENFGGRMYTESSTPMHCSNPASAKELAGEFFKRVFEGDKNAKTDVLDANDEDLQMPKSKWKEVWAADWDLETTLE